MGRGISIGLVVLLVAGFCQSVTAQSVPPRIPGPGNFPSNSNLKAAAHTKTPPGKYESTTEYLLKWIKSDASQRYQFALDKGVKIQPTEDGRSFVLIWKPPTTKSNPVASADKQRWIVSLHGSMSWAFDEFQLWQPEAESHGVGIIAVQWWLGRNADDYYHPLQLYPILDKVLREQHVAPGKALLHGFSRGSANVYALATIDRVRGGHYFSTIVANAGGYQSDYPPNRLIDQGDFGDQPLVGTNWIFYGGGRDKNQNRDGLTAMKQSREWVESKGGRTILNIADPNGDHGGFHRTPKYVRAALDAFERTQR